jgi:hypothetical protein
MNTGTLSGMERKGRPKAELDAERQRQFDKLREKKQEGHC